jgi:RNA polymerase sigma-54 factor
MFQQQITSIKPLTTAHLAQTMTLLGMSSEELSQKIESELAKNPALELVEERRCPTCKRTLQDAGPCPVCSHPNMVDNDEPIVFVSSINDHFKSSSIRSSDYSIEDLPDDNFAPKEDLSAYVLRQIASELSINDRPIAAHILTSIDEDGLLQIPLLEVSRYHHVTLSHVESIVELIQKADPLGVGSQSPEEALLMQIHVLQENCINIPELAEKAIREGMSFLSRHQYVDLAKILNINPAEAEKIAKFISNNLNPFPGRAHWGDIRQNNNDNPPVYHQPDIIIKKLYPTQDSPLIVEILLPLRGTLQINPLFRKTLKNAPDDHVEQWKKDLENANLLIKCIQQRNNTMQRLMAYIAEYQREFILKGDKHLRPITRAAVSKVLEVHESTISRAVAGKSLQLPSGRIIPVNKFFDRSLPVRAHLNEMIKFEKQPLTDSQISKQLARIGYKVARRTVAKYRSMEGILPAHLRKNLKK